MPLYVPSDIRDMTSTDDLQFQAIFSNQIIFFLITINYDRHMGF